MCERKVFCLMVVAAVILGSVSLLEDASCDVQDSPEVGDYVSFQVNSPSMDSVSLGSIEFTISGGSLRISGGSWNLPGALLSSFDSETGVGVFLFSEPTDIPAGSIFTIECVVIGPGDCDIDVNLGFKDASGEDLGVESEDIFFDNPIEESVPDGPSETPDADTPSVTPDPGEPGPGPSDGSDADTPADSDKEEGPSEDQEVDGPEDTGPDDIIVPEENDDPAVSEGSILPYILIIIAVAALIVGVIVKIL